MDLLNELKSADKSCDFIETKNYYYENHICAVSGNTEKVNLDFTLSCETTDRILRFAKCALCGKYFYHYDYSAKSF